MKLPIVTNKHDISLEMAVWLVFDEYDRVNMPNYLSATGLMKPIRHIVLPPRIPVENQVQDDVEDYISAAMGTSLHAAIEKSWLNGNHVTALKRLGYAQETIDRVLVNPTDEQVNQMKATGVEPILVYIEQRAFRSVKIGDKTYTIGGKFDMVCAGRVTDTKSTSVWSYIYGGKDDDYRLQGSIYKWLNPGKITDDVIRINHIFTDWSKADAARIPNYPPRRVVHKEIPLMTEAETEVWIINKLTQVSACKDLPEHSIPECTPEELWMSAPKFKYYADPTKALNGAGKSTKNFDTLVEAEAFKSEKGKGIVIAVPGSPKRCGYCNAFPICTQKDRYTHD